MSQIVVFNALQTSLSGGIGRYSFELAKELYALNPHTTKIVVREEDLILFKFAKQDDLIIVSNIKNSKDRNFYEQFKLPQVVYKMYPKAILHYPDTMAPIFARNQVVITVHDLAFKSLSGVFTKKTVLWKNFITNLSIKKANKIIAITNFTKSELLKHYPKLDNEKISVVYNGFNDFSQEKINENNVSDLIKSLNTYMLTVSTISPRKNVDNLIRAFELIKDQVEHDLVIAGGNGWLYESVHELVRELKLENRVIFTGKINDDELKWLYKHADVFAYVSFYEGFGLPPLEAMSFGVPCVVSNTSSLPEVVGNCAVKVNPHDVEMIAANLASSLSNKPESYVSWLNNFSWEKCAEETALSY